MKILYVLPPLGIAGGIRILIEHCNRLDARGHAVAIAPLKGPLKCDWLPIEVPILHHLDAALTHDWDVAVATEASTWAFVDDSIKATRKFGFCQMKEAMFYPSYARGTVEDLFKRPLIPITISTWLKEWLLKSHEKVHIIPNGVNFEQFYHEPFDSELIMAHKPIVLIEGYETPDNVAKNVRDAHAVVDILRKKGYDILKWGFSQNEEESEKWKWDQFWLAPDQGTIRRIYSTAGSSGGLLLKTTKFEGRNCTVVEAMACHCPVVATHCGGVDDLLDGYTCLLRPYGERIALVEAAEWLLRDPEKRNYLIFGGMNHVRQELHWDEIIPTLETILEGKSETKEEERSPPEEREAP